MGAMHVHLGLIAPGREGALVHTRTSGRPLPPMFHRHDEPEFLFIAAGSAEMLFASGPRLHLVEGSLAWFFPGQEHRLAARSSDARIWVASIAPLLARRLAGVLDDPDLAAADPGPPVAHLLDGEQLRNLEALCRRLDEGDLSNGVFNTGFAWLVSEARQLSRRSRRVARGPDSQVQAAMRRLLGEDSPGIHALAAEIGLSPSALVRRFRASTGLAPVVWRERQRLDRVVALIEIGVPCTEAALQAGFGSYVQCYRAFRTTYGVGPRRWRRREPAPDDPTAGEAANRPAPES